MFHRTLLLLHEVAAIDSKKLIRIAMSRFDNEKIYEDDLDPADEQTKHVDTHSDPADDEDQEATEAHQRVVQIRGSKQLAVDPTLRRLLMKACQLGHKVVIDKLLDLQVKTTGDEVGGPVECSYVYYLRWHSSLKGIRHYYWLSKCAAVLR